MSTRLVAQTNRRNRRTYDPAIPKKSAPAIITNIAVQAPETIRLTFACPVIPNTLPDYRAGDGAGNTVISMAKVSATEVDLTFDGDVEDTDMLVKEHDLGIRTSFGGFVPARTYSLAITP